MIQDRLHYLTYALVAVLVLGLALQPAVAAQPADLTIEQPAHIDENVQITESGGDRIYEVAGSELLIRFENADHQNVTSTSVVDGPGTLEYDSSLDVFRFETDQTGTATVRFEAVNELGEVVKYEAVLQVTAVDFIHRSAESDEQIQEDAQKWQEVEREAGQIDPDAEPEDLVSTGLTFARFIESPFSTFIQDMQAALIILIMRPGGWAILGVLLGMTLIGVASGARYRNRTQKQLGEWGDIQVEKDEAYLSKIRTILQQNDWNQLFPDHIARAMREHFGRNVWQGMKQYMLLRSPASVKATTMQMMSQLGYKGRVRYDHTGEVADAELFQPDGSGDEASTDGGDVEIVNLSTLDYTDEDDRAFIDAVDPDGLDEEVFEVPPERIDLDQVDFPISNRDVDDDELLERVNPDFPNDFEHEEELAQCLAQMMEFVIDHPHTDEKGISRPEMDLVSFMAEMDSVLADEADFYAGHLYRRELLWIAENLSADDEIEETMTRVSESGVGGDLHGGGA